MKKTYMNPTLKVVVLKAKAQMLAGSTFSKQGDFGSASTGGGTATDGFILDGREFDFDDEE